MPTPIPAESYSLLIQLINETYLDKVESITSAQIGENSKILAVAIDGGKRLAIEVTSAGIAVKLMGVPPKEPRKAETQFAKGDRGKKHKCGFSSISCGLRCITASKICRKDLTPKQLQIYNSLRQLAKGGSPVAEKQITAIRVGQLNKTRLANEKAKKAVMTETEKMIHESRETLKASQDAAKRMIEEMDVFTKKLEEFQDKARETDAIDDDMDEFIRNLPDTSKMQSARDALEKAAEEIEQGKLDQAKKAIDNALSQHVDDLSLEYLEASDAMLKESLKTFLGEDRGALEWQHIVEINKDSDIHIDDLRGDDEPPSKPSSKRRRRGG